jgi:hypothetical protein
MRPGEAAASEVELLALPARSDPRLITAGRFGSGWGMFATIILA